MHRNCSFIRRYADRGTIKKGRTRYLVKGKHDMKIAVLAGGLSTERDVSLVTGRDVYKALKERGHKVVLIDVYLGTDGDPDTVFESDTDWTKNIVKVGESVPDIDSIKKLREDGGRSFFGPNVLEICKRADIVFNALHGASGENGKLQAVLDLFGIKYTGTGYMSSAIAMDKAVSKTLFKMYGVNVPECVMLRSADDEYRPASYPAVVKICNGGSSVGVYIAKNENEYESAVKDAFRYESRVIVEQYIKGREFTCCVIEGRALPIVEIAPKSGFYDYKNKYQAGSTIETCPAEVDADVTAKIQAEAVKAYNALGIKAYARIDFLMNSDNEVFCLEANTLPGMTPTSLIPQEAAAEGMSYGELCEKIIEVSLRKQADNA